MFDCYFAAPLFNVAERLFNERLAADIRLHTGKRVYLPQVDGGLVELGHDHDKCFIADISAMRECHFAVAVLHGAAVDSGTAWECGYLYSLKIPIYGLVSDPRFNRNTSLMVMQGLHACCATPHELLKLLQKEIR